MATSPKMDPLSFAYWLQGFSELNTDPPTPEQWQLIKEHLGTVFVKVTPPLEPYERPNGGFIRTHPSISLC